MTYILGLNCSGFRSSACLATEAGIQAATCEERVSRIQNDRAFPLRAIEYCLDVAGIEIEDVSKTFVGWHPRFYLRSSDHTLLDAFRHRGKLSYLALNELATLAKGEISDLTQTLSYGDRQLDIHFVDHHKAHLGNAYFQSGFQEADFLILDGFGELSTGMAGSVDASGVDVLESFPTPHSLGSLYSAFTDFLGFRANRDEWKVMALAAQGDADRYYEKVRRLVRVNGLRLRVDISYLEHFLFFTPRYYSAEFIDTFGEPVPPGEEPSERHCDLVAAMQRVVEEVVFELLAALSKRTGRKKLVVGGGFFMNSVCNGKLLERTDYEDLYVGGSPEDSGIGIGSALFGGHFVCGWPASTQRRNHNYFGRTYSDSDCRLALEKRKIRARPLDDAAAAAAEHIADGKIVGWFQGASEFGPRALGNRSILADPTRKETKDLVNATVKFREGFRPFAPAILKEKQDELCPGLDGGGAYFMEKVRPIHPAWQPRIPAVVHTDGSGRLQSVDRELNPLFHRLISEFEKRRGVPLVLNTSFNTNGMPMVETPGDAIGCFFDSGLDTLILGTFLVEK